MSDIISRKLSTKNGDVEIKLEVKFPANAKVSELIKTSKQFIDYCENPGQIQLDLTTVQQVEVTNVTMVIDKPRKNSTKFSGGLSADKVDIEKNSTLFNWMQTGKKVDVIFREQASSKPKAYLESEKDNEQKDTEEE